MTIEQYEKAISMMTEAIRNLVEAPGLGAMTKTSHAVELIIQEREAMREQLKRSQEVSHYTAIAKTHGFEDTHIRREGGRLLATVDNVEFVVRSSTFNSKCRELMAHKKAHEKGGE